MYYIRLLFVKYTIVYLHDLGNEQIYLRISWITFLLKTFIIYKYTIVYLHDLGNEQIYLRISWITFLRKTFIIYEIHDSVFT